MAEDVKERVTTEMRVSGAAAYSGAMRTIGNVSSVAGRAISRTIGLFTPLRAAIGLLAGGAAVRMVAQLGHEFEENKRVIAGTLATLGVTGDFTQGLQAAEGVMQRIVIDAAKLPGEAEDYVEVYRAALPGIVQAIGGTTEDMAAFSNKFTATLTMMGVSSRYIGQGLQRMLTAGQGTVYSMSPAWRAMLPFIQKAAEQMKLTVNTSGDFNKLTQKQRADLIKMTLAQQGITDMIADAEKSWDAQLGTFRSLLRIMGRMATSPLFEAMKKWLYDFNHLFMDSEGHLTNTGQRVVAVGRLISTWIVDKVEQARNLFKQLPGLMDRVGQSRAIQNIRGAIAGIPLSGGAGTKLGAGALAAMAPGMLMGVMGGGSAPMIGGLALATGVIANFAQRTTAVNLLFENLSNTVNILTGALGPFINYAVVLSSALGDVLEGVLNGLLAGLNAMLEPVLFVGGLFAGLATSIITYIQPALMTLWSGLGALAKGIGEFVGPIIKLIGIVLVTIYEKIYGLLLPVLDPIITAFGRLLGALGEFLSWLGQVIGKEVDKLAPNANGQGPIPGTGIAGFFESLLASINTGNLADAFSKGMAPRAPGARGGANINQDFRNSRFTIEQKFAEGFDPDRVAVAFANDLGRIGEQRLSSGFSPLFGIR